MSVPFQSYMFFCILRKMGWLSWFCQLFCLQLLLFHFQSFAELCSHDQSSALLKFKQLFSFEKLSSSMCDGMEDSYPKLMSWKEDTDCCSWDGVTCDMVTGHVIGLDLSCSWLHGDIPPDNSLFLLPHLQRLNLAYNDFNYSQVSSGFVQFPSLTLLNLTSSRLSGQLPSEFSHLSKLVTLDISNNFELILENSVVERLVKNLTRLEELVLDNLEMSTVEPNSFSNLSSSLTSLSLTHCGLQGNLPDHIFLLPNLQMINLVANFNLTGMFPKVNWSSPLWFLDVSSTSFSGELPESIGTVKSLTHLNLYDCNFFRSVPTSLGNLTQLTRLDLSSNNFSGHIPPSLSNLNNLQNLDLSRNSFTSEFPDVFVNLTGLHNLDFSRNQLTGPIPSGVSRLQLLGSLYLHDNLLNGTIPSSLFNLPLLEAIDLSNNQLTGHIDEFQSNLLRSIDLSNNRLQGSIPSSIFELVNLTDLSLSSNNLTGTVELDMFANLTNLGRLNLSHNSLSVSSAIKLNSSFPNIYSLSLSSCNISEFPDILRTLNQLVLLDLSDNKIHGRIPNWTWSMGKDSLSFLNLSHNFLAGVEQLPWLRLDYLDLHSNLLQGPFPVPPPNMRFFFISHNQLTGEITHLICNMSTIEVLDLSYNNLSGTIPQCMGNFSNSLRVLDMRKNRFHGTIPGPFAEGSSLRTLNFHSNELEGPVPRSLVNCTMLEVLDLGNNQIKDTFPYWLETLPELQVLVLRSNKFYGLVKNSEANYSFSKLRIFDLSNNNFNGSLSSKYFENLKAMMNVGEAETKLQYMGETYYQDSLTVIVKGFQIDLVKVLTVFTTIDFSNNSFSREIPQIIGKLHSLRLLNLSHNSLSGHIPSSLGNLTALESLDLSSNKLVGEIPRQLASLTFLAVLNLSHNQLVGAIPRGNQFDTFQSNSYSGNLGLCGVPLSNKCSIDETPEPSSTIEDETQSEHGIGWQEVLIGYGCGTVVGVSIGYIVFSTGKPRWLVRMVDDKHRRKVRRSNNKRE